MKKFTALLCCALMAFPMTAYAQNDIKVKLDGNYINFTKQAPTVVNNRTLVPLRGIFEGLGYNIEWEPTTKTATLKKDDSVISIRTGASALTVNGANKTIDVPAQIINSSLMLPLRAIGEAAGISVIWDNVNKTVLMTTNVATENTATNSVTDIAKYVAGYSKVVAKMASFDQLAQEMYSVSADNAEAKIPALKAQLSTVQSDLTLAKSLYSNLQVPPALSELHNLCGNALNKLEQLCDLFDSLFNGGISNEEAKNKISTLLEESKAINSQIAAATAKLKS